ncbi:MAG: enoyl-CoA hydratase/isomerase family protein [Mariniblastus sp.]
MIELESQSGIAILRMNHGKVNAMDIEFCRSLSQTLLQVDSSDDRAAILTGNDRVFSAGVDLVRAADGGSDYLKEFLPALVDSFTTIFKFSKPLVAAINGHAVAGGCILAAACDTRLTHSRAKIGLPELRVGVALPSIAIEIMRFVASTEAFQTMVTVGKNYRGEEAIKVGLADRIVDREKLMEEAVNAAEELLRIPATVFAISKRQMRSVANRTAIQNAEEFDPLVFESWFSDEIRSVIEAYVRDRL